MSDKVIVLTLFILVYLYLIFFKQNRAFSVWGGIGLIFIAGIIGFVEVVTYVNWNVIGILAGTLILAEFFTRSRVPAFLADHIIGNSKSTGLALLRVCMMSGFLSVFVENVAVVLMVAPIALELVKRLKVSPVPVLIGVAVSSNLQGMAILIGDPPALILAEFLKMNFNDFFVYKGRPGLFFAVEISAAASLAVLYYFFRRLRQPVEKSVTEKVKSWFPSYMLVLMIILLSLAPLKDPDFVWLSGTICMVIAAATVVWSIAKYDGRSTFGLLKKYEFDTTFFLAGVFVLVKTFDKVGLITDLTQILQRITGESVIFSFIFIIIFSMAVSAFIDNVPYITMMIPVTYTMGLELGGPQYLHILLMYGLLIGACLGGNITPIGAAANIVSVGILKKEGYKTSFLDFIKIGLPFTLAATAAGALFIWFIWK